MDWRHLRPIVLFSFVLFLAPQICAQNVHFEQPQEEVVKKKPVKHLPPGPAKLEVLNGQSTKVDSLIDGDVVKLKVTIDKPYELANVASFKFVDDGSQISTCIIAPGEKSCETKLGPALGWYWSKNGQGVKDREIRVESVDSGLPDIAQFLGTTKLQVAARPVVLIHGLGESATVWLDYTKRGEGGYLSAIGLNGYAVGDGQFRGKMLMGDPSQPQKQTKTIDANAEELASYIAGVKSKTGAQVVDLVAHDMGGLVARYYIDRLMADRDVAQLIMLGSPHGGTSCANLPASLGFYLPSALELRPVYMTDVFNRQITHRHGVPFHMLAGASGADTIAPCTESPNDMLVSRSSVAAITAPIFESNSPHSELPKSDQIFKDFVAPRLQKLAGEFPRGSDSPLPEGSPEGSEQFTKIFTGHIKAGSSAEIVVNLDKLSAASFALYDSSQSLTFGVRGASGEIINPTPGQNGLIQVQDPRSLFTYSYVVNNPKPGPLKIVLRTTAQTPGKGASYALAAKVTGGARLVAKADRMITMPDQQVTISSALELAGRPLKGTAIQALIRHPDGETEDLAFTGEGNEKRAVWIPKEAGVYGVDVIARGAAPDGLKIERAEFLSFEVQPDPDSGKLTLGLMIATGVIFLTGISFWLMNRRKAKQPSSSLDMS